MSRTFFAAGPLVSGGLLAAFLLLAPALAPVAVAQQRQSQPVPTDACRRTDYTGCRLEQSRCLARCAVASLPPPCRLVRDAGGTASLDCPPVVDDTACRTACAATERACVSKSGC